MAKRQSMAETIVRSARVTAGRVGHEGKEVAAQLAAKATEFAGRKDVKQAVKQAKKTVARARTQASALASKAAATLTGRPKVSKARKGAKLALAVVGAAAVTAAGVNLARRRKR